jgi:hypothetical protein
MLLMRIQGRRSLDEELANLAFCSGAAPEGVSHKGTRPDCADQGTELMAPIKSCGIGCPAAATAIPLDTRKM